MKTKCLRRMFVALMAILLGAGVVQAQEVVYDVKLEDAGTDQSAVVQVLDTELGINIKKAQELVANTPCFVLENAQKEEAKSLITKIRDAGGQVSAILRGVPKELFDVKLIAAGEKKLPVIQVLKKELNLGLAEAKALADAAPCIVLEEVEKAVAEDLVTKLVAAGATAQLTPHETLLKKCDVKLVGVGANKLAVIAALKNELLVHISLAKEWAESVPCIIAENVDNIVADYLVAKIAEAGGTAETLVLPDPTYDVKLVAVGESTLAVVKVLMSELGIGLRVAKDLADAAPCIVLEDVEKSVADALAAKLVAAGATVEVLVHPDPTYDVKLVAVGENTLAVVKVLMSELGIGLAEAKDLADAAPCIVLEDVEKKVADAFATKLVAAGATAEVLVHNIVSGVETLPANAVRKQAIYNLKGVRFQGDLKHLPAGVYIVNGQKVMK